MRYKSSPLNADTKEKTRRVGNIFGDSFHEKQLISGLWVYHCDNGPAVIYASGTELYFINGIEYTKEKFLALTTNLGRILYG